MGGGQPRRRHAPRLCPRSLTPAPRSPPFPSTGARQARRLSSEAVPAVPAGGGEAGRAEGRAEDGRPHVPRDGREASGARGGRRHGSDHRARGEARRHHRAGRPAARRRCAAAAAAPPPPPGVHETVLEGPPAEGIPKKATLPAHVVAAFDKAAAMQDSGTGVPAHLDPGDGSAISGTGETVGGPAAAGGVQSSDSYASMMGGAAAAPAPVAAPVAAAAAAAAAGRGAARRAARRRARRRRSPRRAARRRRPSLSCRVSTPPISAKSPAANARPSSRLSSTLWRS